MQRPTWDLERLRPEHLSRGKARDRRVERDGDVVLSHRLPYGLVGIGLAPSAAGGAAGATPPLSPKDSPQLLRPAPCLCCRLPSPASPSPPSPSPPSPPT